METGGDLKLLRNRYEGMWFEGCRNGVGVFYYSNASKYEGEWTNNKKEGYAFYTDASGEVQEAIFQNDRVLLRLNEPKKIHTQKLIEPDSQDKDDPKAKDPNKKTFNHNNKSVNKKGYKPQDKKSPDIKSKVPASS
jgi:hypothetical protein